jgi:hypothetical protein
MGLIQSVKLVALLFTGQMSLVCHAHWNILTASKFYCHWIFRLLHCCVCTTRKTVMKLTVADDEHSYLSVKSLMSSSSSKYLASVGYDGNSNLILVEPLKYVRWCSRSFFYEI